MYVLFAVLCSLLIYAMLLAGLRMARQSALHRRVALGSFIVLAVGVAAFNLTSRAVNVDLGPFRSVTYSIPEDYVARGGLGLLALVPYAVACLSPVLTLALLGKRR